MDPGDHVTRHYPPMVENKSWDRYQANNMERVPSIRVANSFGPLIEGV